MNPLPDAARPVPAAWHGTVTDYPRTRCLHHLFDDVARAHPDAPAARHHGRVLTYRLLHARAAALAARLRAAGVRRGRPVGVCGTRSLEALVAILGVLRAGGVCVPLDGALPPRRLHAMAEDADVSAAVVLPGSGCPVRRPGVRVDLADGGLLPGGDAAAARGGADGPEDPGTAAGECAQIVFTSGSTGRPKPVAVPHRGIVRLARSDARLGAPGPGDGVLHGYELSADASTIEIWSALLGGACLVLVDRDELLSPAALERRLRADGVTVAYLTTGVFHLVARTRPGALRGLRYVSAGGEVLDPALAAAVTAACPDTTVCNLYGPTENAVVSTVHVLRRGPRGPAARPLPIGRPLANSTCHVLRPDGRAAAVGEVGELYVGGDGLALGYPGDTALTAARFGAHPARPGERLYRTGDLVRWRADGALDYHGRADRQVKVRGHRVEPAEVEARLRACPEVGEAVVVCGGAPGGGPALAAFVTPAGDGAPVPLPRIRARLADWLPAQAVPDVLRCLPAFPVTEGGKVDRRRLRALARDDAAAPRPAAGAGAGAAVGHGEPLATLAGIWRTALRADPAPGDDFFRLGGDSLRAAEVVARTLAALGLDAAHGSRLVRALLTDRTLQGYAAAVRALRPGEDDGARSAPPARGPRRPEARAAPGPPVGSVGGAAPEPREAVDFAAEARLGFPLPRARGPAPAWRTPRHVLLTGATGFVGAYLLDRLLRRTDATVHCPVRARDPGHAARRVAANLTRYGLSTDGLADRVACVPGELGAARLGLAPERWAALGDTLDLVLHSGARVNFLYPYGALRAANVGGTRELVRLAAPRRVPVHFLSTVAVLAGCGVAGADEVAEDAPLAHPEALSMGYAESKWVAERLLRHAADAGLPVTVHRPYEVMGDQERGVCNTETAICSLLRVVVDTGLAPDIALPMDFVPVDHLADAVLALATGHRATGRTYHLTSPRPALLGDVLERLRAFGCPVRTLPYAAWVDHLVRYVGRHPTSPTAPFVSLCVDACRTADMSVKEMYLRGTFPRLRRDNAERDLATVPACPPTDASLVDHYLRHLFRTGYLTRPHGGG
ncbi:MULTISPECIES: non-ribosomal peptide synthetase [Streptomyces]|uniref:non-ribosomal peptide synthetase n=1 Tax=Streptomyces TaxID=1883 RepID=UPI002248D729|nr:amino acid adenylation domain-containing protein [Streptomyces sp. JHD 1]MCX2968260.1 amino acid adenylation domain-containing protein [Streptomyces sp. JHD 1]